jgi:adenylate cyclase
MTVYVSDSGEAPKELELCVLFSDVSGSTRLYEVLGDTEASRVIGVCLKHLNAATQQFQGRPIQTVGDELLATFPTAELGVLAAEEMMRRIESEPPAGGRPLALRIGLHYGPVLMENNNLFDDRLDIFGDTVNTAARIVALAKSRQILTSATTRQLLPLRWRQASRDLDMFSLKGKSEDIQICEILWQKRDDITVIGKSLKSLDIALSQLILKHQGRRIVLDGVHGGLTLGREAGNDIVIDDRRISRQHARIERRRDKFVLVDKSTNGTYVTFEGKSEILLRMEEVILYGRGRISLGQACQSDDPSGILEFEVL